MDVTLESIRQIVSLQLGVRHVKGSDHLLEDLGAESVDIVNIVVAVEDRHGVYIREDELPAVGTVDDLYALTSRLQKGS